MRGTDENTDHASELRRVMSAYRQTVFGLAVSQLGDRRDAEDVYQEVFLAYFRKAPVFENEAARRAWLIRTTIYLCKRVRRSIWNTRVDKQEDAGENIPVQFSSQAENEVWDAVRKLNSRLRIPVYLFYFEDMPVSEIASLLDIDEGAVKMRLMRARKQLRKRLEGEYFE